MAQRSDILQTIFAHLNTLFGVFKEGKGSIKCERHPGGSVEIVQTVHFKSNDTELLRDAFAKPDENANKITPFFAAADQMLYINLISIVIYLLKIRGGSVDTSQLIERKDEWSEFFCKSLLTPPTNQIIPDKVKSLITLLTGNKGNYHSVKDKIIYSNACEHLVKIASETAEFENYQYSDLIAIYDELKKMASNALARPEIWTAFCESHPNVLETLHRILLKRLP